MTFPIQLAAIGAGLIFALYFIFKDRNTARPLTYGAPNLSNDSENTYNPPPCYDTHPLHDGNSNDKQQCIICLCDMGEDNLKVRKLRCQHEFHEDCIRAWLATDRICPICRKYA